jgi:hypothetical protein
MASPFDWPQFLDVAAFCLDPKTACPSREALDRTVVGRAYYAAYCTAAARVRDKGWFVPKGKPEDHGNVRMELHGRGCIEVAKCLRTLSDWRHTCDYEKKDNTDFAGMASRAIQVARKAINGLPSSARW